MTDLCRTVWRAFHLPKAGHAASEYEDAFAGKPQHGRFAIADGASESAFAGEWARILVQAYVEGADDWSLWLPDARRTWRTAHQKRDLSWYSETKFKEGAFATLLGLTLEGDTWRAEAIGDSCLFQVRDGGLRRGFPVRRSSDFGNRPALLSSRSRGATQLLTKRMHLKGEWIQGDFFLLMTDALAQWFLHKFETRSHPWTELRALETQLQFAQLLKKLREEKELRNDDVTLLMIEPRNS